MYDEPKEKKVARTEMKNRSASGERKRSPSPFKKNINTYDFSIDDDGFLESLKQMSTRLEKKLDKNLQELKRNSKQMEKIIKKK